jgi:hypothetical protein
MRHRVGPLEMVWYSERHVRESECLVEMSDGQQRRT